MIILGTSFNTLFSSTDKPPLLTISCTILGTAVDVPLIRCVNGITISLSAIPCDVSVIRGTELAENSSFCVTTKANIKPNLGLACTGSPLTTFFSTALSNKALASISSPRFTIFP